MYEVTIFSPLLPFLSYNVCIKNSEKASETERKTDPLPGHFFFCQPCIVQTRNSGKEMPTLAIGSESIGYRAHQYRLRYRTIWTVQLSLRSSREV
jgi:hypothetical protein